MSASTTQCKLPVKGGKNMKRVMSSIDNSKQYDMSEAIRIVKESSFRKFDETVDISVHLNIGTNSTNVVRGVAPMPAGTGKVIKVCVICSDSRMQESKDAGADEFGNEDIIDSIKLGNINCDVYIATPDMMPKVAQVARILGPRNLMPNPKLGTVTADIKTTVEKVKSGQVEFKADKLGVIRAGIAKVSFGIDDILSNTKSFLSSITKMSPKNVKGGYINKVYLSSTMGPSIRICSSDIKEL